MRLFVQCATEGATVRRSIRVALFVGTLLAAVNHYDMVQSGECTMRRMIQILVTYLIPYCVATYGAAMQARAQILEARSHPVTRRIPD
jgi:hypothetical protein